MLQERECSVALVSKQHPAKSGEMPVPSDSLYKIHYHPSECGG